MLLLKLSTGSGENLYNGNRFWNVLPGNSWSNIRDFPDRITTQNSFTKANSGYWLSAENPNSGGGKGFTTLLLKFDKTNAANFINSYKRIFNR